MLFASGFADRQTVSVSETTVHKYRDLAALKDDVRTTRQVLVSERKPKTESVKQRPDPSLRKGVPSFDAAHVPASSLSRKPIHS